MLTENLMRLTIAGGTEWVMWLLIGLSVLSISVIVERLFFFRRRRTRLTFLDTQLTPLLNKRASGDKIRQLLDARLEPALAAAAAADDNDNLEATEKSVSSALARERLALETRLGFLGTLGSNAPFIGLFGTVLGIIRAFNDLSLDSKAGSSAVMSGISEALVATAIGLFVAIPAVMAFNYFQRELDHSVSVTEALAQGILATKLRLAPAKKEA
ncbi:MAG: MotA/TolQ/ExbB proton channel family protein [Deltaproteobacteria bacterium]|nr:MotA/TolQ/ExbB proton channel family protein [Deltaproteobacteria bacterium]